MRGSLHKRLQGVCFSFPFKSMNKNLFVQNDMLIISLEDIRSVKKKLNFWIFIHILTEQMPQKYQHITLLYMSVYNL